MNSEQDKLDSTITIIDTDKEMNIDQEEDMTGGLERKDTQTQEPRQAEYSLPVYGTEIQPNTETYEISSSDSDVTDYGRNRGKRAVIEEDSDASPPEKINIGSKGSQRIPGNRKRERIASDADSEHRRSRTTGDYVGRREAILRYNEAKEEALQLDREKLIREYSEVELFKKAKIDMVKVREQLEENSIDELITKASGNCAEVLRIARTSSNLKGTFQKSLKLAAATSLGIAEILKEKMSLSKEEAKSQEIKSLKREISRIKLKMEEEIERERRKALQAAGEAEAYRSELQALKKEKHDKRKDKTPSPKEKDHNKGKSTAKSPSETPKKSNSRRTPSVNIKARDKLITSESEHMEVDEKSPKCKKVSLDDPKKWPESHKENGEKRQSSKEGKEEGHKNRKNISDIDSSELANLIRDIVAKELDRCNSKKPRITEIQTLKEPLIMGKEAEKFGNKNKQEKEDFKSNKSTPRETPRKNMEKERKRTLTTEEETDREKKELPWSKVIGRKEKKTAKTGIPPNSGARKATMTSTPAKNSKTVQTEGNKNRKAPKSAVGEKLRMQK
ncbi:PREDICTED: micronuclear linker histone polyprotein-like [Trachymyrmex cornetzi]|uniref:micronuclear linker histone polyprotein-like n=1 Tax=Trachymyrmex cornetzi TaxID=471704 RepID=UPI00084F3419|nr:PREDICTED: micronuclear linker histone polyprotein-like [Trachymyrmex cornetzi]